MRSSLCPQPVAPVLRPPGHIWYLFGDVRHAHGEELVMRDRKLHLLAYVKTGPTAQLAGAWRHPEADLDDIFKPERYEHMARVLEVARFDGCFFADTLGLPDIYKGSFDTYLRYGGQLSYLDPMTVLPVMARVTRHLGLGATLSTTFHHPYHLARTLASLDHLSHGRACWNVVTSTTDFEARNFGLSDLPAKEERYDRADEVVEACCALWGLLARRRAGHGQGGRALHRPGEGALCRLRGPLCAHPRTPDDPALAARASGIDAGRVLAPRPRFCRALGRGDLLLVGLEERRDRILHGHQGTNGPLRPRAG